MSKYRIHTVAQLTGLSAALIRAWESRYSLVVPLRTPAGYRLYSDEDVAVLLGAQRLLRNGMAPMQVAKLTRGEIRDALPRGANGLPKPPGSMGPPGPSGLPGLGAPPDFLRPAGEAASPRTSALPPAFPASYAERVERLIEAFAAFDQPAADRLLAQPLAMLPIETACERLLIPLLHEVGERWHRGELSVAAEHFGTELVRKKLKALLEALRLTGSGKRLCCACPPGEQHELGLLMFTLIAVAQGWEVIYLGVDLPLADLVLVVERIQPQLVCLSFVQRREPPALLELLGHTVRLLAGRARLLVGGTGLTGLSEVVRTAGAVLMPESGQLDDLLKAP